MLISSNPLASSSGVLAKISSAWIYLFWALIFFSIRTMFWKIIRHSPCKAARVSLSCGPRSAQGRGWNSLGSAPARPPPAPVPSLHPPDSLCARHPASLDLTAGPLPVHLQEGRAGLRHPRSRASPGAVPYRRDGDRRTWRGEERGGLSKGDPGPARSGRLENTFFQLLGRARSCDSMWSHQALCQSTSKLERLLCILRDDCLGNSERVALSRCPRAWYDLYRLWIKGQGISHSR